MDETLKAPSLNIASHIEELNDVFAYRELYSEGLMVTFVNVYSNALILASTPDTCRPIS